jgi:cation diffusion facilitator family transporter
VNKKVKTARLSIFSNIFLILIKILAGILSGSVSIISEAIHSTIDLVAAVIAFFSVRVSDKPPDDDHPYGHGKYENVSGVIEALLILVAAFWIIYEAIKKFAHPEPISYLYIGVLVMSLSATVNFFISRRLYKVARATDSIALEADALHLKTDVYTSLGVAIGMLVIWITGLHFLDPIIAIFVALIILKESYNLLKTAFSPLVDSSLPEDEIGSIKSIIDDHVDHCISYHNFRTRKSGSYKYLDFHLVVPQTMTVKEAHDLCDTIEFKIKETINLIDISIHIEPGKNCS